MTPESTTRPLPPNEATTDPLAMSFHKHYKGFNLLICTARLRDDANAGLVIRGYGFTGRPQYLYTEMFVERIFLELSILRVTDLAHKVLTMLESKIDEEERQRKAA